MESSDREILLSINGRLIRLEGKVDGLSNSVDKLEARVKNLEALTVSMREEVIELRTTSNMTLWTIGIGFALLAALITFVGVYVPHLLNSGKAESKPSPSGLNAADVLAMIHTELRAHKEGL